MFCYFEGASLLPEVSTLGQGNRPRTWKGFEPEVVRLRTILVIFLALAMALAIPFPLRALNPDRALGSYTLTALEEGLPQNTVLSLAHTPDGYIWMGTYEGLVRFDGLRFVIFDRRNTPALGG